MSLLLKPPPAVAGGSLIWLASEELAAQSHDLVVSGIPGDYELLKVIAILSATGAELIRAYYNEHMGNSYCTERHYGWDNTHGAAYQRAVGYHYAGYIGQVDDFGLWKALISNRDSIDHEIVSYSGFGGHNATVNYLTHSTCSLRLPGPSRITAIRLDLATNLFRAGSKMTVYGVKGES